MNNPLLVLGAALALICSQQWLLQSPRSQAPQVFAGLEKSKTQDGETNVGAKSKRVRKALEDWYARNMEAFRRKDVAAIMILRADDFHTITPDGQVNTRADMETRTKGFLARIDHFISQENKIGQITLARNLASAAVTQKTVRMQRFPDGTLHKVEGTVVQRETWKKTKHGWRLYQVDNIRDRGLVVDDKPYKP